MARNPALRNEMLRNQDRALSNIESMPGGFNLLQRMYTDVQEPLMNAVTEGVMASPAAEAQPPSNPFLALLTSVAPGSTPVSSVATATIPNPWSPNTPAAGARG